MMPPLEEIRERCEKATAGPWRSRFHPNGCLLDIACDDRPDTLATTAFLGWTINESERNANFIAHAREDVPVLLAYVEELEAAIRANCEHCGQPCVDGVYCPLYQWREE